MKFKQGIAFQLLNKFLDVKFWIEEGTLIRTIDGEMVEFGNCMVGLFYE